MSVISNDYWESKKKYDSELQNKLFNDLVARCNDFPIEQLSTADVVGSSLYSNSKQDFYFSIEMHQTFLNIVRTLKYFPVNQSNLRTWRFLVDEAYKYINYDILPTEYPQFITEFLTLERVVKGIQIFNLWGTDPETDIKKASQKLGLSPERLSIFIPRTIFEHGSIYHLTKRFGLSKETGLCLNSEPLTYSLSDFNVGEGEFFKPVLLYMLKTIAKRRSFNTMESIRNNQPVLLSDFKAKTWGLDPVNKSIDHEDSLLHPFPAYDNMLCRVISREEYLDIYGL